MPIRHAAGRPSWSLRSESRLRFLVRALQTVGCVGRWFQPYASERGSIQRQEVIMVAETRAGYALSSRARARSPGHQAFQVLHLAFVVAPVVAGLDKFVMLLADWSRYLSPTFATLSPLSAQGTMYVVGAIEIAAGLVVALKPRIGAWIVAGWLAAIIFNLVLLGGYWDIALRDLGLMLGAIALARLAVDHERPRSRRTRA
jgi:hypothetical protein